ncbi:MAG: S9 family peptidase [Anaerolineae bacterium]|nr:S9 family peptidase [Anaerolineae bacterium]
MQAGGVSVTTEHVAPYGAWKSPLTSDLIVSRSIGLGGGKFDGDDVYWLEGRPAEAGRYVIVRRTPDGASADGGTSDVTPPPFNARTRVHEYGGGAVLVDNGIVIFSNFADQRLYRVVTGGTPSGVPDAITPEMPLRYADCVVDPARNRLICVREDHSETALAEHGEAVNTIAAIALDGSERQHVLVSGNDFYATPRLSPDGNTLAWLTWRHPNMPWDGTELWIAEIQPDGTLANAVLVAGGENESIFQPSWSPDGRLYFVSDRSGWWNLYRLNNGKTERLVAMEAEFGAPQWVFGISTYAFESTERIICTYTKDSIDYLASLDTTTKTLTTLDTPYTSIGGIQAAPGKVLFGGASPTRAGALVYLDLTTGEQTILKRTNAIDVDPGYLSTPQSIEFPTTGGLTAYGIYYPPHNQDYTAPEGEKPPLLVLSHGGPTGATSSAFSLGVQYWTSRGFAVLDINYGGSAGYGRAYRERLNGQWGVVDVDDCANGARYLVEQGLVDPNRLAIRGGSAGGYTTLCALTFRDVFKAGASRYGIGDLEAMATDTHKFESRYLDNLIGPYPERRDLYVERSPIHHIAGLNCPVIFFQGLEDKVVPPNQAEMMVEALRAKGIPVAYLPFEGEQHGFRRAENIKRSLDAELYFYGRIFGFELADPVEPVEIENL